MQAALQILKFSAITLWSFHFFQFLAMLIITKCRVCLLYTRNSIQLFTGCEWKISFIQPEARTIPLTTSEQMFYNTDVYTLNNCFIIIY